VAEVMQCQTRRNGLVAGRLDAQSSHGVKTTRRQIFSTLF